MQTVEAIKWALLGGACSEALITLEQIAKVSEKTLKWPYRKNEIPILCTAVGIRLFLGGTLASVVVSELQFSVSAKVAAFALGATAPLAFARVIKILRLFNPRGGAALRNLLQFINMLNQQNTQLGPPANDRPPTNDGPVANNQPPVNDGPPANETTRVPNQAESPENPQADTPDETGEKTDAEQ
ncbi:hypothetical protein M2271_001161 [Streptomyces sp. LBL]|uniref:hypothetical protein n=1 Tax=Streptomyces sp. LBL TaxID=2940562 RepID=UPI002475520B|nr:hypothetical protein [Streptomyces sp. LBL]MDH6623374.1 hypothetical protein [Streptomyces sp. LBL]